jgi:hypothetical protein
MSKEIYSYDALRPDDRYFRIRLAAYSALEIGNHVQKNTTDPVAKHFIGMQVDTLGEIIDMLDNIKYKVTKETK